MDCNHLLNRIRYSHHCTSTWHNVCDTFPDKIWLLRTLLFSGTGLVQNQWFMVSDRRISSGITLQYRTHLFSYTELRPSRTTLVPHVRIPPIGLWVGVSPSIYSIYPLLPWSTKKGCSHDDTWNLGCFAFDWKFYQSVEEFRLQNFTWHCDRLALTHYITYLVNQSNSSFWFEISLEGLSGRWLHMAVECRVYRLDLEILQHGMASWRKPGSSRSFTKRKKKKWN